MTVEAISSPNQIQTVSHNNQQQQINARMKDWHQLFDNEQPQAPVDVDETTVYELASTSSSEVEEVSLKDDDDDGGGGSEMEDSEYNDEAMKNKVPEEPQKDNVSEGTQQQQQNQQPQKLQESSHSCNFPTISLHDSQHSIVSGLTQTITPFSGHRDDSRVDRLRDELAMLKLNVLKQGHQLSKKEIVDCLDKIREELCSNRNTAAPSVVSSNEDDDEDSSMAGSEFTSGDENSNNNNDKRKQRQRRKKSKSLPPIERGRKNPRKPNKKNKDKEVSPSPKESRSTSKGRKTKASGGSSSSSRRKQRTTIKANSERSTRSVVDFNSESLRKILKGEGTFKMSTLKEEQSHDTRSTKSSTKSKGRSTSLNPKNRNSTSVTTTPKMGRKPANALFSDFSGQLDNTDGLKRKKAPRRKSAPMMGVDLDQLAVLQQAAVYKATELNDDVESEQQRTRDGGGGAEGKRKEGQTARRQSAPMMGTDFAEAMAAFQLEHQKKQQQEQPNHTLGDDKTRSSRDSQSKGDDKTRSSSGDNNSQADNESTGTKKKKKSGGSSSKKIKNRRRSMTATYTDHTGLINVNPIMDLSARTEVTTTDREESPVSISRRKGKKGTSKSRKPKNRRASMEDVPSAYLSQPVALERGETFDDVVSRLKKNAKESEEDFETPIVNKKQSRRASISDFTFVSEHSLKLPNELPLQESTSKSNEFNNPDPNDVADKPKKYAVIVGNTGSTCVADKPKKYAVIVGATAQDNDDDSPIAPLSRSKLQQAKRTSAKILSKVAITIASPRGTRKFMSLTKRTTGGGGASSSSASAPTSRA